MEKHYPYKRIIEDKLEQLPGADVNQLWEGMHAILDEKMPQKKDKRRVFGWVLTSKGMFLLAAASFVPLCYIAFTALGTSKSTYDHKLSQQNTITNPSAQPVLKTTTNSEEKEERTPNNVSSSPAFDNKGTEKAATPTTTYTALNFKKEGNAQLAAPGSATKTNVQDNGVQTGNATRNDNISFAGREGNTPATAAKSNFTTKAREDQKVNVLSNKELYTASISLHSLEINKAASSLEMAGSDAVTATSPLKDLLKQQKKAAPKEIEQEEKGPFVGLLAGADLSSVHFKAMRTGANKGIVAGYAFNKRWSIESGIFWNDKNYFGDGSFFRPDGFTAPAGFKMDAVNGKNELYEWPINVKYTIIPKKHGLFVTAGISSYFMSSERYDYEYEQNGVTGKSYSSFKNETKDWFSVANFSLGYRYKIANGASLRFEPYIKLPIKDIGVNNMPVVSTGLNVGFTKQLFR
jgi:cytoskeletal protein RodZ